MLHMKKIVMIMSLISLIACGTNKKSVSFTSLEGEWIIKEVNNKEIKAEETPFLGFNITEKSLYGNAGCNSVMGFLETDENRPGTLSFGSVGSTKRMCSDMAAEDAILQAIGNVKEFKIEDNKLILKDEAGQEIMKLQKR